MGVDLDYSPIEGDHDTNSGEPLARGWCLKHGNRARVMRLKRGKAALRAEAQGQGMEVHRGRNVANRSARTRNCRRPRSHGRRSHVALSRKSGKDIVRLQSISGTRDLCRWRALFYEEMEHQQTDLQFYLGLESEDECVGTETPTDGCFSDLNEDSWALKAKEDSDDTCSFVSEFEESSTSDCSNSDSESVVVQDSCSPQAPSRWEEAVLRAELAALAHAVGLSIRSGVSDGPQRFPKTKKRKSKDLMPKHVGFDAIQAQFLKRHGPTVLDALKTCFREPIHLKPAPLSAAVQTRFEVAFASSDGFSRLVPAFHGTNSSFHDSIFERGLLIPDQDNGLRVLNGSLLMALAFILPEWTIHRCPWDSARHHACLFAAFLTMLFVFAMLLTWDPLQCPVSPRRSAMLAVQWWYLIRVV